MKRNYQLAIVGYGGMGSYHAKQLLKENQNINVVGTFDILEVRRAQNLLWKAFMTMSYQ